MKKKSPHFSFSFSFFWVYFVFNFSVKWIKSKPSREIKLAENRYCINRLTENHRIEKYSNKIKQVIRKVDVYESLLYVF